jgi:hypothetical protein
MPTNIVLVNPVARKAYRQNVLNLPGPIDRWLITNARSPRISFLQDYLMIAPVASEYVTCVVNVVHRSVTVSVIGPFILYIANNMLS